jgi:hypothetical protein
MSHNALSINGKAPDASGSVIIGVEDLSDVSAATAIDGQGLQYTASTGLWTPAPLSQNGYMFIGTSLQLYNSEAHGTSFAVGQRHRFQTTALRNTIVGATANKAAGKVYWYESITLPAGRYSITSTATVAFSSSGYYATLWKRADTGDGVSTIACVGTDLSLYPMAAGSMLGTFELTATTTIECKIEAILGASASQTSAMAIGSFVLVRQLV